MQIQPRSIKITNKTQNSVTFSPLQDGIDVMKASTLLKPRRFTNQGKSCRIANLCLSANIDKATLKELDQLRFTSRTLNPGEILCRQGQLQDHLYAVRSGMLKSYITQSEGREFVMGFHLPPDIFGWEGIDAEHLSTTIVALDHCNVCEIPLDHWEQLISEIPGLGVQLLRLVSQKIRFDNHRTIKTTVEQRVANFLLQLMTLYRKLGYPEYLCKLPMTHQDIANYLRIAPETISRSFRQLQQKGAIRLSKSSKRKLYIKDFEKLEKIANASNLLSQPD